MCARVYVCSGTHSFLMDSSRLMHEPQRKTRGWGEGGGLQKEVLIIRGTLRKINLPLAVISIHFELEGWVLGKIFSLKQISQI